MGDENSHIFHQILKKRTVNIIHFVQNKERQWVEDPWGVSNAFLSFYQNLLGSAMKFNQSSQQIIAHGPGLSEDHKQSLRLDFSAADV